MIDPYRIDVHHHLVPPFWAQELDAHGGDPSGWLMPDWTPESDLLLMDELGIRTAMLSLTCPGVSGWQGAAQAVMARRVNEYAAGVVQAHPGRFGSFATLPMNAPDAALRELAYALDILQAQGVVLLSNYDGSYLGDARFEPVWQELDRRAALVLIHPTVPRIDPLPGVPGPMLDFPFDTTRAAISMLVNGTTSRYLKVRVILSHAGGFLPYGAYRFAGSIAGLQPERSAASIIAEMKRFYFDTALSTSPSALPCLLEFAEPDHILFGSDIPYARNSRVAWFTRGLDDYGNIGASLRNAINCGNASDLLGLPA